MSNHYNQSQNKQLNQQSSQEANREEQTRSVASKTPFQESNNTYLHNMERAHQQNKTSSDTSYELMITNSEESKGSESYETKNFTTIKSKPTTSIECKFQNNGNCTKPNCRYQHFCLKNLTKTKNQELKAQPNEVIKNNKLIIIEVTELKYVPKDEIHNFITQQLNDDTKLRQIKIAITNKRSHKKLITNIKLKKQNRDGSDDEQIEDWEEIIKNIDTLKNNLKEEISIKKLIEIKGNKETNPDQKREINHPNYNQLNSNKIKFNNKQKQTSSNETMLSENTEEENQNGNTIQTIQRGEQGRLAESLGINSEGDVRQMFLSNQIESQRVLQSNGEDLYTEIKKPTGKVGYIQMAKIYTKDQERIIFKEGLEINEITRKKLITQVKYRKTIENKQKKYRKKLYQNNIFLKQININKNLFLKSKGIHRKRRLSPNSDILFKMLRK